MKDYYMVIERDSEGWYIGNIPTLPGCHTQARTIDELTARMQEALTLYLEDSNIIEPEFIGVQRYSDRKSVV